MNDFDRENGCLDSHKRDQGRRAPSMWESIASATWSKDCLASTRIAPEQSVISTAHRIHRRPACRTAQTSSATSPDPRHDRVIDM
jgi:hypothetical protein